MAQISWFYTLPYGKKYEVNLFHGDKDHNVLIHCNGEIILIDFLVDQSKKYSFCVENHLVELSINRLENGTFDYQLEGGPVQYDSAPLEKRDNFIIYGLTASAMILFIVLLFWIFSFYRS